MNVGKVNDVQSLPWVKLGAWPNKPTGVLVSKVQYWLKADKKNECQGSSAKQNVLS